MNKGVTFGHIVKERRHSLGLTQAELGRRVGCAAITIRKIEADVLRPSVQVAEHLAVALNIPEENHLAFIRLARAERDPSPLPTPQPSPAEIGQEDLSGRAIRGFELGERIGTGGYGVVYRAVQTTVSREVAVKIILPKYADRPEFIRRFEAEAQLVARLEHPHIVPLYDYWREPSAAYLIMRLLRGGSLEMLLKDGPLPHDVILHLMEQLCAALHAAHRAGVIHRDIKPANILLDDERNAYLADFGIAKHIGNGKTTEQTREGTVIGSPAYISPEQILAEPVKPQTDIYSLGVVLYELLTGHKPFRGSTPYAYIQQHLNTPLPLLAEVQENGEPAAAPETPTARSPRPMSSTGQPIPTALDIVIGRATAKEPRNRYLDILSLLADLRQALTPGTPAAALAAGKTKEKEAPHVAAMIELPELENPYKGLRSFTEADAADFFGRGTLIQDLLARMAESTDLTRFLAVVGPSGSGKSSVVRAGLIPALRQGGLPGSEAWFITEMLPGPHPLEELEAALLRIAINPPESLLTHLHDDERGLLRTMQRILPTDESIDLVLVIDQFEELFTLVETEARRAHFLNSLVTAILDPDSRLRVVITLRADFTDQPLRYVDFGELVRQRTEFVLPLTPDELEQAIAGPTEQVGLALEPELMPTIIRDIGDQPGTLPLLQYALTELFERRQGRLLTLAAYQESGGVFGALARRADELYDSLDDTGQAMTRQLFLRLVTLGEGAEDTRRRVLRSELTSLDAGEQGSRGAEENTTPDALHTTQHSPISNLQSPISHVIDQFGRYRLLTFDHDPVTRGPTVEVAHEALLREWGRLREWLSASRTDVRLQRLLAVATAEWIQANRDPGYLLRGGRLDQFEEWAASTQLALTYEERTFLKTSLANRRARQAEEEIRQKREIETVQKLAETESRAARRLRRLAVGLALVLVVALGAAWFAFTERNSAQANFTTAERIRLAAQAQIALDNGEGGDLPALLALRSLQHGYTPEADAALLNALKRGFSRQQYLGHSDEVRLVDFSPDGRYVLTASADKTARLWDAQTGREIRRFIGHTGSVNAAIFSPDGRYILTGSYDDTARLWDAETAREVRRFTGSGRVWGIAFTPDGAYAIASDDNLAHLWNVQTGAEVRQFRGHTDTILWLAISPDGQYLATVSGDKTARLWAVQTGQELRQFLGHSDWVGGVRFSTDGQYLLTTSADKTARLWDVQTGQELRRFVGHTDRLYDASFSPDGQYVVTSSYDKTARLWNIASGQEVRQFLGHTDFVSNPVFSVDGRYLLTGSGDRTARLWEVWPETEPQTLTSFAGGYHLDLFVVNISPDKRYILTGWTDGTIQVWDTQSSEMAEKVDFQAIDVTAQVMSADNHFVFAGDSSGIVRMVDAQTSEVIRKFMGHTGSVQDIALSPDGDYVLSGSADQTAQLWQVETGQEIGRFIGHQGAVRAVAFSPQGDYILTGSEDNLARLWDAATGREVRQFVGHTAAVLDVAFSNDGRYVLTGSDDDTARLWEAETGQEVRAFIGHTDQVSQVAFSPDGHFILTGSADQTARLWNIETGHVVRQFVGHDTPLRLVAFSDDGQAVITADSYATFLWRAMLEDVIDFACHQLSRDLSDPERTLYNITDPAPTCPNFAESTIETVPTWTPVPATTVEATPLLLSTEIEFQSESANIQAGVPVQVEFANDAANLEVGVPMQDVYIEAGDGQIVRPQDTSPAALAQPLYRATELIEPDFLEEPFEVGPFAKGEPHGFTLAEWLAATGRGTYTVTGSQAVLDFTFENLRPNGVYTLWCSEIHLPPHTNIIDRPCGAVDGSENRVPVDDQGHGEIRIDMEALPPSTEDTTYSISLAYHSDGQTHGSYPGEFGYNLHVQLFYELPPPAGE